MLGDELFAVEIGMVQEVVEWERLEPVPRAPDFVLGVFSYHGRVITVVNLAKFFGKEAGDIGGEKRIVILTGEDMSVGFMVDKTERIENFDRDSLLAGAELALEKGFVKAVVNHGGRLYNIVDIERLLEHIEDRFSTPVQRA